VRTLIEQVYKVLGGYTDKKEQEIPLAKANTVFIEFPIDKVSINSIFDENDMVPLKRKHRDKFEGYEEYMIFREFWSGK
jgi:hypothetical protein